MTIPTRVQRSRKAGAKQPEGTRYCGRGTKYGNPNKVETVTKASGLNKSFSIPLKQAHEIAVDDYRETMSIWLGNDPAYFDDLFGFAHLSCFCTLDLPCHVDAIIEHLKHREQELKGIGVTVETDNAS